MTGLPQTEVSPVPRPDDATAPYWEALSRGELLLRSCLVCGALSHPIVDLCRVCESPRLGWEPAGSGGRLFSWVVESRSVIEGMDPPYIVAQVTPDGCDDGEVRLIGTLLVDDPSVLEIGARVSLDPSATRGLPVPLAVFSLAEGPALKAGDAAV